MIFTRYAVYYLPPERDAWAQFATAWLGWDALNGRRVPHPALSLDSDRITAITDTPRKYGLHATMKPPFHLAEGSDPGALEPEMERLAASVAPVALDGLDLAVLGSFLALRPRGRVDQLNALAAACVRALDPFRAPPSESDNARRRKSGLSARQESNLQRWGYPYVMDDFRFHITLSGRLAAAERKVAKAVLDARLGPLLPSALTIDNLALVGEDNTGHFRLIRRFGLGAKPG